MYPTHAEMLLLESSLDSNFITNTICHRKKLKKKVTLLLKWEKVYSCWFNPGEGGQGGEGGQDGEGGCLPF